MPRPGPTPPPAPPAPPGPTPGALRAWPTITAPAGARAAFRAGAAPGTKAARGERVIIVIVLREHARGWWERDARLPARRCPPGCSFGFALCFAVGPVARPPTDRARTTGRRQSRRRGDTLARSARRAWAKGEGRARREW